jgi:hypothetical protein
MVSEAQRYLDKAREAPEASQIRRVIEVLQDTRKTVLEDVREVDEP